MIKSIAKRDIDKWFRKSASFVFLYVVVQTNSFRRPLQLPVLAQSQQIGFRKGKSSPVFPEFKNGNQTYSQYLDLQTLLFTLLPFPRGVGRKTK